MNLRNVTIGTTGVLLLWTLYIPVSFALEELFHPPKWLGGDMMEIDRKSVRIVCLVLGLYRFAAACFSCFHRNIEVQTIHFCFIVFNNRLWYLVYTHVFRMCDNEQIRLGFVCLFLHCSFVSSRNAPRLDYRVGIEFDKIICTIC